MIKWNLFGKTVPALVLVCSLQAHKQTQTEHNGMLALNLLSALGVFALQQQMKGNLLMYFLVVL